MENPIDIQLAQACASLAAGVGLGLFYDFLRIFRIRLRGNLITLALDTVFWVGAGLALFILGLGPGEGELRLFMLAFSAIGAALYFLTLSPVVMTALTFFADILSRLLSLFAKPLNFLLNHLKKIAIIIKNSFQKRAQWFTIHIVEKLSPLKSRDIRDEGGTTEKNSGKGGVDSRAGEVEAEKNRVYY